MIDEKTVKSWFADMLRQWRSIEFHPQEPAAFRRFPIDDFESSMAAIRRGNTEECVVFAHHASERITGALRL